METLITAQQVIDMAFADGGYISAATISSTDIATAEQRYLTPVVGYALHAKLLDGGYESLLREYVAPVLALYTRIVIEPCLSVRTGQGGAIVSKSGSYYPADKTQTESQMRSLRAKARSMLRRLSAYMDENAGLYPEYNPQDNILKYCKIDGNFVQIH